MDAKWRIAQSETEDNAKYWKTIPNQTMSRKENGGQTKQKQSLSEGAFEIILYFVQMRFGCQTNLCRNFLAYLMLRFS